MAKSNYKMRWYDHIIMGIIQILIAFAVGVRWFSRMIGERSYSELGSSKTSGIAYAIAQLEGTNWRFLLVGLFLFMAWIFFRRGYRQFKEGK